MMHFVDSEESFFLSFSNLRRKLRKESSLPLTLDTAICEKEQLGGRFRKPLMTKKLSSLFENDEKIASYGCCWVLIAKLAQEGERERETHFFRQLLPISLTRTISCIRTQGIAATMPGIVAIAVLMIHQQ